MDNFCEFLRFYFMQGLAPSFKFLKGFDDGLGHAVVGLSGASDDGELFTGSEAFMAVAVVETEADEAGFRGGGFPRFTHARTVAGLAEVSSGFSSRAEQTISVNDSF